MALLVEADQDTAARLSSAIGATTVLDSLASLRRELDASDDDLVVVGPDADLDTVCEIAAGQRIAHPARGFVVVRRRVTAAILADALRAGIREVVSADDMTSLNEACRTSLALSGQVRGAQHLPGGNASATGKIVTVASSKGGVGKTTVATNLAATLARLGHRVCVVDLDLAFGDVAIALQLFPTRSMADAAAVDHLDDTAMRALLTPHSGGLDALLAPMEPTAVETIPPETVTTVLAKLKEMYDYVVVDTPPAFTEHVLTAFDVTDTLLLVASLDVPALKNLRLMLQTLDMLDFPADRRLVVLNRADAQVGLSVEDAAKVLGSPIGVQIPSSRAVPASINRGVPIVIDEPAHPVSQAFGKFVKLRFPRTTAAVPTGSDRRRLAFLRRGSSA